MLNLGRFNNVTNYNDILFHIHFWHTLIFVHLNWLLMNQLIYLLLHSLHKSALFRSALYPPLPPPIVQHILYLLVMRPLQEHFLHVAIYNYPLQAKKMTFLCNNKLTYWEKDEASVVYAQNLLLELGHLEEHFIRTLTDSERRFSIVHFLSCGYTTYILQSLH